MVEIYAITTVRSISIFKIFFFCISTTLCYNLKEYSTNYCAFMANRGDIIFKGFTYETISFMFDIRFNNNKEFMNTNREVY